MALNLISKKWVKWYRRHVADTFKTIRRQIRRAVCNPKLAFAYHGFRQAVARRDWLEVHRQLPSLAEAAKRAGDVRLLAEMSFSAERLDEHEKATDWAEACAQMVGNAPANEWRGGDLSGATLLISLMESEKQGVASGLHLSGYVAEAAAKARHCVIVAEKRLVPIFSRTLPEIEVVAFPATPGAKPGTHLVTANALTLRRVLGSSPNEIEKRFMPLKADPKTVSELREAYRKNRDLPLIGISWWSSHFGKDLPSIDDWSRFARDVDALFVNIQYGDVSEDLAALERAAPGRIITDDSVNQLVDMDRFAAQLGALDAIVTISNTGAHLAGGMGAPTCLIRDDWFRRGWPVLSNRTPWYPNTTVYGRNGRPWPDVLDEIKDRLSRP